MHIVPVRNICGGFAAKQRMCHPFAACQLQTHKKDAHIYTACPCRLDECASRNPEQNSVTAACLSMPNEFYLSLPTSSRARRSAPAEAAPPRPMLPPPQLPPSATGPGSLRAVSVGSSAAGKVLGDVGFLGEALALKSRVSSIDSAAESTSADSTASNKPVSPPLIKDG